MQGFSLQHRRVAAAAFASLALVGNERVGSDQGVQNGRSRGYLDGGTR
jgi:hypothetical protein